MSNERFITGMGGFGDQELFFNHRWTQMNTDGAIREEERREGRRGDEDAPRYYSTDVLFWEGGGLVNTSTIAYV